MIPDIIKAATNRNCPWCENYDGSELSAAIWYAKPWRNITLRLDGTIGRVGMRLHKRHMKIQHE